MSDNGFYGFLTALLAGVLAALADRVPWAAVPGVALLALVGLALAAVVAGLAAIHWAAERELAQPLAHPIC